MTSTFSLRAILNSRICRCIANAALFLTALGLCVFPVCSNVTGIIFGAQTNDSAPAPRRSHRHMHRHPLARVPRKSFSVQDSQSRLSGKRKSSPTKNSRLRLVPKGRSSSTPGSQPGLAAKRESFSAHDVRSPVVAKRKSPSIRNSRSGLTVQSKIALVVDANTSRRVTREGRQPGGAHCFHHQIDDRHGGSRRQTADGGDAQDQR